MKHIQILPVRTFHWMGFVSFLFTMLVVLASCDTEDVKPDDTPGPDKAIIPEKGKNYHYKITDADGAVTTSVTSIKSSKDSLDFAVHQIQNMVQVEDGRYPVDYTAYSTKGFTTYEIRMPAAFAALLKELRPIAYIEDSDLTGFPQYQIFDNKGTVNSPLTFKGDPIHFYLKLLIILGDDESVEAEVNADITYQSGKAVKEERITTPAGAFDCTKWEYTYRVVTKFEAEGYEPDESTENIKVSLWTAPGVGIVKSVEESEEGASTTELQKIEG
jgi:hypothetical protein